MASGITGRARIQPRGGSRRANHPSSKSPVARKSPRSSMARAIEISRSVVRGDVETPPVSAPTGTPTPNANDPDKVWPSRRLTVVQETRYSPGESVASCTAISSGPTTAPSTSAPSGVLTDAPESRTFTGSENRNVTAPGAEASSVPGSGVDERSPAWANATVGSASASPVASASARRMRLAFVSRSPGTNISPWHPGRSAARS